ncbi:hypothetical protein K6119_10320 [Paracrocinitomix mangrovi]|uniref:hypothetical protein n=1 Tax=Paracrocinitomix mangrovi TaxID=2862509 RepID=UPI001C8E850E|nr:hypothetical protein [Paracrocinitomix mangrovi]UKN00128.1 hypothetical protein K6119_10320 [Paracrocinitomix mangrovi]
MMKTLTITLAMVASMSATAQQVQELNGGNKINYKSTNLIYEPTIPADSTFTVTKNTTGQPLTEEVLKEINLHRMKEDYLWRVNGKIEILIHAIQP